MYCITFLFGVVLSDEVMIGSWKSEIAINKYNQAVLCHEAVIKKLRTASLQILFRVIGFPSVPFAQCARLKSNSFLSIQFESLRFLISEMTDVLVLRI